VLKVGGITVAIDGTKVLASASKHAAVSHSRAGELMRELDLEIEQLLRKAEDADSTPLDDGLSIPEEVQRRQERKAQLRKARAEIEARAQARAALEGAEYERKRAARAAARAAGKKPRRHEPPRRRRGIGRLVGGRASRPARCLGRRIKSTLPTRKAGSCR
jgi:hypothetical protein